MRVTELPNASQLRPQKLSARRTPHAVIEPNTTCNIRCSTCYSVDPPLVKPLLQVQQEIDLACARRALDSISLLGGEPTLHPQLEQIVRHVKARGLNCQVLSNGLRFLQPEGPELLTRLIAAGVDRFMLHVDARQAHVHADVAATRRALCAELERRRVWFGLSLTLAAGEEEALPALMREQARYRFFDGVLVTLAMDFERAFLAAAPHAEEPDMGRVAAALQRELGLLPTAYVPSSLEDDEVCWLMYMYWLDPVSGRTLGLSPRLDRLLKAAYRASHDHELFAGTLDPERTGLSFAACAAAELALQPGRAGALLRSLRGARLRDQRFHYIVLQQAPRMNTRLGQPQICWQCPDATIRDGKLTPVCIAGRLRPLGGGAPTVAPEVIRAIDAHLEQV